MIERQATQADKFKDAALGMRAFHAFASFALLGSCAESEPKRPVLEPPAPIEDFFVARERMVREVSDEPSVTRTFLIGWDMHYGYSFSLPNKESEIIWPDFADQSIRNQFDAFVRPGRVYLKRQTIPNEGKTIVCHCTGVEWSFGGEKNMFLVRSAKLEALP